MIRKRIYLYLLMLIVLVTSGCGVQETASENILSAIEIPDEDENELLYITTIDKQTEPGNPVNVNLSEQDGELLIENGGEYVISGENHYPIKIDVHDEVVHLFLNNVNIQTTVGAAIDIVTAGKVVVTLMDDTMNTLYDAAYYSNEEQNATISAACDLTINGNGTLYVSGIYRDAINTKDVLKIISGQIQIKSKRYGLKGNDGILLSPELLIIESERVGCITDNANKEGKGIIDIRGGDISIVAGEYALSAASDVYIREGAMSFNSVIDNIYTEGQQYIAEGTLAYE